MLATIIIGIIVFVCLVSSLIFYVFTRSRVTRHNLTNEKQQIINTFKPSMGIITTSSPYHSNIFSNKTNRLSYPTTTQYQTNELAHKKQHRSAGSINTSLTPARSTSMLTNLFPLYRPRSANWRQGAIVDPKQMALIQFSLPINNNNKYRRRSIAICNSIAEPKENPLITRDSTLPCLLSFSFTYLKNSQLKVQLHSIQSLPKTIHLQQLTIKIKLTPDGKEKSIHIKSSIHHDTIFEGEYAVLFSNIPFEKLHDRTLTMSIHGKDQTKKTIHLGHIGKIHFNQIHKLEIDNEINFMHEIEKIKQSSVEVLISLAKLDDQHMRVDLQRIKGLKIDQKKLDTQCYLQVLLLDRHRPLSMKQTKSYQLNSSNFTIGEQFDFNVLSYNSNNLDRLMVMFNLYSNCNSTHEYKCIGRVKLASSLFCSGNGIIHWQQFQARGSFSMWHTLNKEQH